MTRVAAVDCGTNSIRLLIADTDGSRLHDQVRRMEIVRLGQGIDRTGRIAADAMERTLAVAREYASQCTQLKVDRVRFVATSASRDAANAADFTDGVARAFERFGIDPEVVTGAEEAALSFRGATSVVGAGMPAPYLVIDLGGGSTEFVLGEREVRAARSVDIGCVRLTERRLHTDPPTDAEIAATIADISAAIDQAAAEVPLDQARTLVGLAGSVTTVTAHALGLSSYDPDVIDGARLPVDRVIESCNALLHATRDERAAMGFMHPGRVDVIGSGALIWRTIVERLAGVAGLTEVVTSEHDILDGIALGLGDQH
ncbi:Ppx/GppA phosphatase family protein [Rudaeicoccus suwonensis]|uniref:Exopolyphosphatase/guanosine-5'-triphosphate, 3'-diphosphate pyrophosphatase n=1 Tax=Rudaeicoccus suwonensis TaxID=657409 RepID=A0A561E890_9MICO|nr:Ppx/GppA phosphatase family protein [Rudaeicoccus suwonensis]TWE11834.1 exopolyphosphatase/guanosine-5'-triphosphate,3'-diphosphate pyrophosphatase [Rudaeicoccus suwonensis]